ncbi:MAG TPA: hypothetical protein VLS49_13410 [Usitatibacter sp.]|nr:hypothetical protein [Usitatibacter sp.]
MACNCEKCQAAEKLATNITPEVEQLLEQLAAFTAAKLQDALPEKVAGGLPTALTQIIGAAGIVALAESFNRTLPRERMELVARLALRILATSDRLKAEHEKRAAGIGGVLEAALRGAGIPAHVETITPPPNKD